MRSGRVLNPGRADTAATPARAMPRGSRWESICGLLSVAGIGMSFLCLIEDTYDDHGPESAPYQRDDYQRGCKVRASDQVAEARFAVEQLVGIDEGDKVKNQCYNSAKERAGVENGAKSA